MGARGPKVRVLLFEEAVTETLGQCSKTGARQSASEERVGVLEFRGYSIFEGPEELSVVGVGGVVRGGGKDRGREGWVSIGERWGNCREDEKEIGHTSQSLRRK